MDNDFEVWLQNYAFNILKASALGNPVPNMRDTLKDAFFQGAACQYDEIRKDSFTIGYDGHWWISNHEHKYLSNDGRWLDSRTMVCNWIDYRSMMNKLMDVEMMKEYNLHFSPRHMS